MEKTRYKKLVFGTRFIAPTKDGFAVGRIGSGGKHKTLVVKNGRVTVHSTSKRGRVNLFGKNLDKEKKMEREMKKILKLVVKNKKPKWIHPYNKNELMGMLTVSFNKKTMCLANNPAYRFKKSKLISYGDFLKENFELGLTDNDELVMNGSEGCYVFTEKDLRGIAKCLFKHPVFQAFKVVLSVA